MATIHSRIEGKRGCGFRKPGGLYLVSEGIGQPCGKLPIPLIVCPCCGQGVKPSRGWTWINWELIRDHPCKIEKCKGCVPFDGSEIRFGLLWIGEKFYSSPEQFTNEAKRLGVSRRISAVPHDFKIGETWVLVAHRKAIRGKDQEYPGIFHAFKPTAIEYIVKGTESDDELDKLEKRGFTLIDVKRDGEQSDLDM